MAITFFQPEIWAAQLLSVLEKSLVYAGPSVVNRDYEGEIANAGDTVHITSIGDPTIGTYTKDTDITVQVLTDADRALLIDQQKYFAFEVDDIDLRQVKNERRPDVRGRSARRVRALRRHRPVPRPADAGRCAGRERPRRGRRDHGDQRLRQADRPRGREAEPGQRPAGGAGSWSSTRLPTASCSWTRGSSRSTSPAPAGCATASSAARVASTSPCRTTPSRATASPHRPLGYQGARRCRGRHVQPGRRRSDRGRHRHRCDEQDRLGDR
jgi:hypothetical protein